MGFLFSVMVVLVLTSAEIAIVMCYLQLAAEDHQWWWRSFFNVASAGFYMFLYSLWYLIMKLDLVGILPTMVYLTYMSMISMALALCCGSVGTLSCFWFTKTIYKALKVD
jgi:transmembrane 9 superfamily protein 2/4